MRRFLHPHIALVLLVVSLAFLLIAFSTFPTERTLTIQFWNPENELDNFRITVEGWKSAPPYFTDGVTAWNKTHIRVSCPFHLNPDLEQTDCFLWWLEMEENFNG